MPHLLALLIVMFIALPAPAHAEGAGDWSICQRLTAEAERQYGLPGQLLGALARAESGRFNPDRQAVSAWPWTIHAEGRGRYFPSREAAIAAVKKLRAKGVRSIDVGCMQINLAHHPDAFASAEAALNPVQNVDYAARFVRDLHERTRSWNQAVAFYHSTTSALNRPYRAKVMKLWGDEIRRAAEMRRRNAMAELQTRRAARQAALAARQTAPPSQSAN